VTGFSECQNGYCHEKLPVFGDFLYQTIQVLDQKAATFRDSSHFGILRSPSLFDLKPELSDTKNHQKQG
jgi:hypothetical protein